MTHTVIRFPTAAKLGDEFRNPNATPVSRLARLKRWLFGYARTGR